MFISIQVLLFFSCCRVYARLKTRDLVTLGCSNVNLRQMSTAQPRMWCYNTKRYYTNSDGLMEPDTQFVYVMSRRADKDDGLIGFAML